MNKPVDEFEATRAVVETLKDFQQPEQLMIIRWAAEKLGLPQPFGSTTGGHAPSPPILPAPAIPESSMPSGIEPLGRDIKSFVAAKNPRSDVQFAATVAYYYQFEAPAPARKVSINKDDLQAACRLAGRARLANPGKTLQNGHMLGYLDRAEAGTFSVNTVGENLVAMTLPAGKENDKRQSKPARKKPSKANATRTPATKAKKA